MHRCLSSSTFSFYFSPGDGASFAWFYLQPTVPAATTSASTDPIPPILLHSTNRNLPAFACRSRRLSNGKPIYERRSVLMRMMMKIVVECCVVQAKINMSFWMSGCTKRIDSSKNLVNSKASKKLKKEFLNYRITREMFNHLITFRRRIVSLLSDQSVAFF
jgi:hypothetical protein